MFTTSLPILAAIGIFLFVVVGAIVLFGWADERLEARQSLKSIDDYDNDLVKKFREVRTKGNSQPLSEQLIAWGKKITSPDRQKKVREKLALAGQGTKDDLDRYLAMRTMFLVAAGAAVVLVLFVVPVFHGAIKLFVAGVGGFALYSYPDIRVNRAKEARQKAILRALPDTLDILTISVEAGLGFEQAVDKVVTTVPGPLSDEFFRMLTETRAGANRAKAMRAIDERCQVPELKAFILAMVQAEQFGVSIAGILRSQAEEMRIKRRQLAQEKAQKLPVKMLLPMVFFIFPSLLIVILGPAAINTFRNFK